MNKKQWPAEITISVINYDTFSLKGNSRILGSHLTNLGNFPPQNSLWHVIEYNHHGINEMCLFVP